MTKRPSKEEQIREAALADMKRQMALEKFQQERPQYWLQSERVGKIIEIQGQLEGDVFPEGSCFLHASTVGFQTFCLKRILGLDLDTCQLTAEIYGDEELEGGVVVLPLESVEWFGFPANAVPTGIHFQGFTNHLARSETKIETPVVIGGEHIPAAHLDLVAHPGPKQHDPAHAAKKPPEKK